MTYDRVRTLFLFLLTTAVATACGGGDGGPTEPKAPDTPAPNVTSLTANSGPIGGGSSVTITGTGFAAVPSVTFGGVAATGVSFSSSTSISATTPANGAGPVSVVVTNPDGQKGTLANGFTYMAPPTLISLTPGSGPASGNTSITLAGTGFVAGATVTVGGAAATAVSVAGGTSITATTPAHAAGAASVVVTNPDGQSATLADAFTYVAGPTVTAVDPNSGPPAGGTQVTITGTRFTAVPTVTFGGSAATGVAFISSTSIIATVPAHAAGAVAVIVTNPDGQSAVLANGFTYAALAAPKPTSISPSTGFAAGGMTVTITGTDFVAIPTVKFGGTPATNVAFASSTSITATVPAHAGGAVDVLVTNPDGQSGTLTNGFTYVSPPTVDSISPTSGSITGGNDVIIFGKDLGAGATVHFGTTPSTILITGDPSSIVATSPPHAAGTVSIAVTNPDGQADTLANAFTYLAPTMLEKSDWQVDYTFIPGGSFRHDAMIAMDSDGRIAANEIYDGSAERTVRTISGLVTGSNLMVTFELLRGTVSDGFVTCAGTISKPAGESQKIDGYFTATNIAAVGSLGGAGTISGTNPPVYAYSCTMR